MGWGSSKLVIAQRRFNPAGVVGLAAAYPQAMAESPELHHVYPLLDVRYGEPGGLLFPLGARLTGGQLTVDRDGRVVALAVQSSDARPGRDLEQRKRKKAALDLYVSPLGHPRVVLRRARFKLEEADEGFELVLQGYDAMEVGEPA
jgi:hypothetical protein